MYYLIYGFLYLISLLPFRVMYVLSDGIYLLLYYVFKYRKEVVMGNLKIAFPEKPESERIQIAKQFYKNFTDTFIETIKILSMSDATFDKRCVGNFEFINDAAAKGINLQILGGHKFNWEYANLVFSRNVHIPCIGVYGEIKNKTFERLFLKLRSKYNTVLVSTADFQKHMKELTSKQYSMYLLADQNPSPSNCFWMNFFGKPAPFIMGPHKAAVKKNVPVIFVNFRKIKRGYYSFDSELLIEDVTNYTPEELARKYRDYVEYIVRREPANYLWSHRRWRWEFLDEYKHMWIDK